MPNVNASCACAIAVALQCSLQKTDAQCCKSHTNISQYFDFSIWPACSTGLGARANCHVMRRKN